ncbi:MAG: plastocyanin/azurin family copper-binding protein [Armatimonadota bacterium]|nr:plastocyanin/azurin family copper-binding protein [Armatimonadota bacterium]MDR7422116.1 plastocyanin/azurin family copper-binding protein [Armatimonadota bacterium]MDR7455040.1 plastocyanin/azurin family copper-binding protein [Armatimonadota bacterium]MDR7455736.1 plastocyanin/azurin family copper-binding protein [Armatimonadota bacterium]MDR7497566.1 plastocyanin/azurin family copper-binding protein [Armatimonadota bacterium]
MSIARRVGIVLTVLAITAVHTPSAAPAPPPATPSLSLTVVAREFVYEPKDLLAKAGEVTFTVRNTGAIEHDFVVENAAKKMVAEARPFPAGKTVQVKARLAPGAYVVYCSIPGHREAGMQATLRVVP